MEKKSRRAFLAGVGQTGVVGAVSRRGSRTEPESEPDRALPLNDGVSDRAYWIDVTIKLAHPVLSNLSQGTLRKALPERTDRSQFAHLEAFGRLMCGIAPWLELGDSGTAEDAIRKYYADLARTSLSMAVNPASPDFMNFTEGAQPLVDAAFLAQAMLRAPQQLWHQSGQSTKEHLVAALRSTRRITPYYSNWILFSAMIEAFLHKIGEEWDRTRVDLAIRAVESWYLGDGAFGDGPEFHWDYYNSFVIQPYLLEILENLLDVNPDYSSQYQRVIQIARRYAAIQERLISPEGSFPPIGRSLAYRFGAFQLLGLVSLRYGLPPELLPAQVRSALTAVIRRQIEAPGTFDQDGWLQIGFVGHQPEIGEEYISVGSCYLCAAGLLPLGLRPTDPFWSGPGRSWTARRIWAGEDLPTDKALYGRSI